MALTCEFEVWKSKAQEGEKHYHLHLKAPPDEEQRRRDAGLFRAYGFESEQFAGETIVDVGAGSHLRSKFFRDARIAAIEPLAEEYLDDIPWTDLDDAACVYTTPAEQRIAELEGQASLALCINVLDHTFDPTAILCNVRSYLRDDGCFLLSVDLHDGEADELHPIGLSADSVREMAIACGFAVRRAYWYTPENRSYGHGSAFTLVLVPRTDKNQPSGQDVPAICLRTPSQLVAENVERRLGSIARRIKRVVTGESRGVRRLLRRSA